MIRRKKSQWINIIAIAVLVLLFLYYEGYSFKGMKSNNELIQNERISSLERRVQFLMSVLRKFKVPEEEYDNVALPVIYVITPTYARPEQKAELTRLLNVFLLVPSLHWIIVEDSEFKTSLVTNFLDSCGIPHTHLNVATPQDWKLKSDDPRWRKPRGVLQRNAGINWLKESIRVKTASGVVYFADDDNTYSTQLFREMRMTKKVSVWPVGLVGGVLVERPKVVDGRVTGWITAWRPDRPFATDMAGFAVNLALILQKVNAEFSLSSSRGFMESDFLEKLVDFRDLEPKAQSCTQVYVWHTRTEKPDLKHENSFQSTQRKLDFEKIEV